MFDATTRAAVEPLVRWFDRSGIEYYIGGSLASIAYGEPRATLDADFVASMDESHAEAISSELGEKFYANSGQIRDAILRRSSFNLISLSTSFKLDVFLPKKRPYSRSEFDRRARLKKSSGVGSDLGTLEGAHDFSTAREDRATDRDSDDRADSDPAGARGVRGARSHSRQGESRSEEEGREEEKEEFRRPVRFLASGRALRPTIDRRAKGSPSRSKAEQGQPAIRRGRTATW